MFLTKQNWSDIMFMYEVCAKCGHVGKGNYVEKVFAIKADSGKEAATIARDIPRVKHHHRDAIRYVKKIDAFRFDEIIVQNSSDPYFTCKNIQEQNQTCTLNIFTEADEEYSRKKEKQYKPTYYGKQMLRNPKKYINNYTNEQRYII